MNHRHGKLWRFAAIAVVIAALFYGFAPESFWVSDALIPVAERQAFGDFATRDLSGAQWTTAAHQGRVLMINTWATWCAPCVEETPTLIRLSEEYKARGMETLGVSVDEPEDAEAVRAFVAKHKVSYPVALSQEKQNTTMTGGAIPVTILVDRENRVAYRHVGVVGESNLRDAIEKLLRE